MKTVGIISEYNPFHNGHKYHIEAAKKACDADAAVCIMSGSFVQRGEPAIFDKWSRAKMAVLSGADLVLELPFVYACQPAEIFAFGAVKILNDINIIDSLCFGSESGDIEMLYILSDILYDEPDAFKRMLKSQLESGYTYPKAINLALSEYLADNIIYSNKTADISSVLKKPNNILGIEYIKAIKRLKSNIKPVAIKRILSDYNETEINSSITSATAIRKEIYKAGLSKKAAIALPNTSYDIIAELLNNNINPIFFESFSDIILYKLRTMDIEAMKAYMNVREGIEYRIKKAAFSACRLEEFIDKIKTKRYTRAYIQRLICHILLNLYEDTIRLFKEQACPSYARVLAFNDKGKYLLKKIKSNEQYPIITKVANYKPDSDIIDKMFYYDLMSTDIYTLGYKDNKYKKANLDYYISPIYL